MVHVLSRNPLIEQVFEAMGMFISKESFYKYAMPCMVSIATQLHARSRSVVTLRKITLVSMHRTLNG